LALYKLNIFLIKEKVPFLTLPITGGAASHIINVLKASEGDEIDIGVQNGPTGKAVLTSITGEELQLVIKWNEIHTNDLYPVALLVGLSRPQTCRKILEQASALGVNRIDFFISDKSEPSYRESRLWKTNEWREKIIKGTEQAFSTFIPGCDVWDSLEECTSQLKLNSLRFAFDNYESVQTLEGLKSWKGRQHYTVAVGAERGWSNQERIFLRENEFSLLSMGPRVLRQETAVVVALGQVMSQFWKP
jgi:RsmE family RNA methyltransferase